VALADRDGVVPREELQRMMDIIHHRGPDDAGMRLSPGVGLGHRRLSIIDLSGGHQPMANEDGTVWIAYNGEVYNHAEWRAPLEQRGHVFRSHCDTEAMIHLYEEHGAECVARLRGMFAFAIWDEKRRSLLIARDHTGIKPLYYAVTPKGDLVWGSEIKAIFAGGRITPELEESAVAEYFALGSVSGARTLYRGVMKLPPAHLLEWRDGRAQVRRYWSPPAGVIANGNGRHESDVAAAAKEFWERFRESVHIQLMSDVPLGVFLSGGLDSSLIVSAMRAGGVEELRTFSVGFKEAEASELPYARIVAKHYQTDHHEVLCTAEQFFDAIPRLTWHRDQPLTFSASIPLYFVSELARSSVKVVLTGEGSDELFAGYGRYPRALWNQRIAHTLDTIVPGFMRSGMTRLAAHLGDDYVGNRVKRSFLARRGTFEDAYLDSFADFDGSHRAELLARGDGAAAYGSLGDLIDRQLLARNPLEAMLRFDQVTYMEELLGKQDQMSMAASIESRVPFLDHKLVEWAAGLSPHVKLAGTVGKALVKAAAQEHLPASITQAKKRGFLVPLARWLRGEGRPLVEAYAPEHGDALLNGGYVRRLIDEHVAGRDHTARLWRVLAFQIWRRDVLHGATAPAHISASTS
jgi:asparagine synthase (glutamine-hydrolysing)